MEKFIQEGTAEYIAALKFKGMPVSIETSHSQLPSAQLTALMTEMDKELQEAGINAEWVAYRCAVCTSHDPEFPIHYEITRA